ncbi:MAG: hypothetical protein HYR94_00725 [Chloroflexi bacterium]|nr:hypothetical protein [Chloroflexota bacterium]
MPDGLARQSGILFDEKYKVHLTRILEPADHESRLALFTETDQQIQAILNRIVDRRRHALLEIYEICFNNLSLLEIQLAQGQDDIGIYNQIEAIKQKLAEIESEIKGETGLVFQGLKLFNELSCLQIRPLVVDDEPKWFIFIGDDSDMSFEVEFATDLSTTLTRLERNPFDLIIANSRQQKILKVLKEKYPE